MKRTARTMAYKRFARCGRRRATPSSWAPAQPESRRQNFYYGHPRNRFWPLLAALLGTAVPCTVEEKTALVCVHGLALWDTVQQCTITGAQDASIRNVTPTDIPWLCAAAPIRRVLCNGAAAYSLCVKYHALPGVQVVKLPSTSPPTRPGRWKSCARRGGLISNAIGAGGASAALYMRYALAKDTFCRQGAAVYLR